MLTRTSPKSASSVTLHRERLFELLLGYEVRADELFAETNLTALSGGRVRCAGARACAVLAAKP